MLLRQLCIYYFPKLALVIQQVTFPWPARLSNYAEHATWYADLCAYTLLYNHVWHAKVQLGTPKTGMTETIIHYQLAYLCHSWRMQTVLNSSTNSALQCLVPFFQFPSRDSNLVDSASSIRLSQRLSHACLSIY